MSEGEKGKEVPRPNILIIKIGLFLFWTILLTLTLVGGDLQLLFLCSPVILVVHVVAIAVIMKDRRDHKLEKAGKRKKKVGASTSFTVAAAALFLIWLIYIPLGLPLYWGPGLPGSNASFEVCTMYVVMVTILCVMVMIYEIKKPWKDRMGGPKPLTFTETDILEPEMITNSPRTTGFRILIGLIISSAIVMFLLSAPRYYKKSDTIYIDEAFFLFVINTYIPLCILLTLMLCIFYIYSKYHDWENYIEDLKEQGEPIPENLSPPDLEDPATEFRIPWMGLMKDRRRDKRR